MKTKKLPQPFTPVTGRPWCLVSSVGIDIDSDPSPHLSIIFRSDAGDEYIQIDAMIEYLEELEDIDRIGTVLLATREEQPTAMTASEYLEFLYVMVARVDMGLHPFKGGQNYGL